MNARRAAIYKNKLSLKHLHSQLSDFQHHRLVQPPKEMTGKTAANHVRTRHFATTLLIMLHKINNHTLPLPKVNFFKLIS